MPDAYCLVTYCRMLLPRHILPWYNGQHRREDMGPFVPGMVVMVVMTPFAFLCSSRRGALITLLYIGTSRTPDKYVLAAHIEPIRSTLQVLAESFKGRGRCA